MQKYHKCKPGNFRHKADGKLRKAHKKSKVPKYKIKYNIWFYNVGTAAGTKDEEVSRHPAVFLEQLAEDHIISWLNPGDLVLDIFMGSGTTAKMAIVNSRNFIGFEISKEYTDLAIIRIAKYIG